MFVSSHTQFIYFNNFHICYPHFLTQNLFYNTQHFKDRKPTQLFWTILKWSTIKLKKERKERNSNIKTLLQRYLQAASVVTVTAEMTMHCFDDHEYKIKAILIFRIFLIHSKLWMLFCSLAKIKKFMNWINAKEFYLIVRVSFSAKSSKDRLVSFTDSVGVLLSWIVFYSCSYKLLLCIKDSNFIFQSLLHCSINCVLPIQAGNLFMIATGTYFFYWLISIDWIDRKYHEIDNVRWKALIKRKVDAYMHTVCSKRVY